MVKYLKTDDLSNSGNFVKVSTQSEVTTEGILDYINPFTTEADII